jgi:threonine dehydratase
VSVTLQDVEDAHRRIADQIVKTPFAGSRTLSAALGCELYIKFENLQFTASFKERGALNALLRKRWSHGGSDSTGGIIAMSAGNHAQALAYHGQRLGVHTTIVMPRSTPNAKVEATRVHGAEVILHGSQFDETKRFTESLAAQRSLSLIHPYDDPDVIAGQGTVALEMLEQVSDLDAVLIPVGGGGLIAGVSTVIKSLRPDIEVIGVQMQRFPGAHSDFHDSKPGDAHPSTVAEGIAVKSPGDINRQLMRANVDDIVLVAEEAVEQAIFDLLEVEKTVAEGAGAAPLAAARDQSDRLRGRRVGMILSGGNIDMMIMSSVLQRGLVRSQRLVRLQVEIPDTPGALAELTTLLGELDSNIMDIQHQRAFGGSSVRATLVDLVLQMRGEEQLDTVVESLRARGYDVMTLA